jgi:hypothetical protein
MPSVFLGAKMPGVFLGAKMPSVFLGAKMPSAFLGAPRRRYGGMQEDAPHRGIPGGGKIDGWSPIN